jgi:hypothetical protein
VLPLSGPILAVWTWLFPLLTPQLSIVLPFVVTLSFFYVLFILGTAFSTKRGLMLGGRDSAFYYPSELSGAGGYAQEREILSPLGLASSEFPLDAMFVLLFSVLLPISFGLSTGHWSNPNILIFTAILTVLLALPAAIIVFLALRRRKKLGRE